VELPLVDAVLLGAVIGHRGIGEDVDLRVAAELLHEVRGLPLRLRTIDPMALAGGDVEPQTILLFGCRPDLQTVGLPAVAGLLSEVCR
jgi:hypothetical protein